MSFHSLRSNIVGSVEAICATTSDGSDLLGFHMFGIALLVLTFVMLPGSDDHRTRKSRVGM